jgi:hypothetical protein
MLHRWALALADFLVGLRVGVCREAIWLPIFDLNIAMIFG